MDTENVVDNLRWSRYNLLFKSNKYGYLVYNALTNSFAELNQKTYTEIEKIRKNPAVYDYSANPGLFLQLIQAKILVTEHEEEDIINVRRLNRLYTEYNNRGLSLTVAPTTSCNFKCSYCYEQIDEAQVMDVETEDKLLTFIERFQPLSQLAILWYGGEPLLKFDTITRISEKIIKLGIPYQAKMVTNGYLLNEQIVNKLNDLKINLLQVTIDGCVETHNSRRVLNNGSGTYSQIMHNLDNLMNSWQGSLHLRVNLDLENKDEFIEVYKEITGRFKGKKVTVYPALVTTNTSESHPDLSCNLNREEEIKFYIELYQKYGIRVHKFYPQVKNTGCVATTRNAFVIGPSGEVYKCWHDIGNKDLIIGKIQDRKAWNNKLLSRYMIGGNHYEIEECQKCFYLPVCDGGCPKERIVNKYEGQNRDYCLDYKDRLIEMLEIYYEMNSGTNCSSISS